MKKKTISTRLLEMLNGQIMTDITFIVQETEVKSHRTVVSSYGGPLRALVETKEERVLISDEISLKAFREVLQYLYTDKCTIDNDNIFELLYAAKTFQLEDLMDQCIARLVSNLSVKNVAAHTAQAVHFDIKEYLRICKEYFSMNFWEVLGTKVFCDFPSEILAELIRDNDFDCSDSALFTACLEWAEYDCKWKNLEPTATNIRTCLGQVLTLMKFSNMPRDEFLSIVVPTEILSDDEVGRIIRDCRKGKQQNERPTKSNVKAQKRKMACRMPNKLGVHEVVEVKVETYRASFFSGSIRNVVLLSLPLSTSIYQVKAMKLFDGGLKQCPLDKFTLEHNGWELANDTTLASIYSPGEDLILKLHSITLKIKMRGKYKPGTQFSLTFTLEEYLCKDRRSLKIKQHMDRLGIIPSPNTACFDDSWRTKLPGDTVCMYCYGNVLFLYVILVCVIFLVTMKIENVGLEHT